MVVVAAAAAAEAIECIFRRWYEEYRFTPVNGCGTFLSFDGDSTCTRAVRCLLGDVAQNKRMLVPTNALTCVAKSVMVIILTSLFLSMLLWMML